MVTVCEIEYELECEINRLRGFRQQTAKYALEVLRSMQDLSLLENRSQIYTFALSVLENVSHHQIEDVAKMINIIFLQLKADQSMTNAMKLELEERERKRQGRKITLTLIDNQK